MLSRNQQLFLFSLQIFHAHCKNFDCISVRKCNSLLRHLIIYTDKIIQDFKAYNDIINEIRFAFLGKVDVVDRKLEYQSSWIEIRFVFLWNMEVVDGKIVVELFFLPILVMSFVFPTCTFVLSKYMMLQLMLGLKPFAPWLSGYLLYSPVWFQGLE